MKLRQLTIAGFRGFNAERTIDFHKKLTVISAPNSHGKTSISEALEFLIYGATSKVEAAVASKEEYRDSYRNRHFPADRPAYIEATFIVAEDVEQQWRIELDTSGIIRRFINNAFVTTWPHQAELLAVARPFVLQHALKYLLLVPPSERFQGFARLLGLTEVDGTFQAILSLCTKPTASLPPEGQHALKEWASLEAKLASIPELKKIAANLKREAERSADAHTLIEARADALLGSEGTAQQRVPKLIAARAEAAAKIYSGDVALHAYSQTEENQLNLARDTLSTSLDASFLNDYGQLCIQGAMAKLQKEADLLSLGVELLKESPNPCPLCRQTLDDERRRDIHQRHASCLTEIDKGVVRAQSRSHVTQTLLNVREALTEHARLSERRTSNLVASMQSENSQKVFQLLGGEGTVVAEIVRATSGAAAALQDRLRTASANVESAISTCEVGIRENCENIAHAEALGRTLQSYLTTVTDCARQAVSLESSLSGPAKLFRQAVDSLAGTAEISLLIDLLEKRETIERAMRVRDLLDGLKDLKKHAEQTLAETMETTMSADLTAEVMKWYDKIRTQGDPDVHFSGFAMDRTKGGDFKSRRLSVKAKSYGIELASAISSLSESKLNALGLCVSIASAIRSPGPWSFLVIDDPIQSWDDEHETRFIDVILALIGTNNRQVVVLSHKNAWTTQVRHGCRTQNGIYMEMTGYTRDGPNIAIMDWSPIDQRLQEALAIANNPTASSVQLQQGEEEIRLAACQLASQVAKEKLGRVTSAHKMNSKNVRTVFVEAGVNSELVDRIAAAFVVADDAHHAPKNYAPNAQRIRSAAGAIQDARKVLE
ncbi:MAG: AAA family ATPase [Candidatus Omnitrophica bacterium]|nr:AAA family ATPase [Candidatus Omnitrophota bacterium]